MVKIMKRKGKKKFDKSKLDLNNNGIIGDPEDKSIAGAILSIKEEKLDTTPELKPLDGRFSKKDINLTYRKGDLVPQSQIEQWKSQGITYEVWFD